LILRRADYKNLEFLRVFQIKHGKEVDSVWLFGEIGKYSMKKRGEDGN
jgi:hypothetical protein